MKLMLLRCIALGMLVLVSAHVSAQINERKVDLYSEGTRISGTVYHPAAGAGAHLPAVILSHGWGGTASLLRPQAERIA